MSVDVEALYRTVRNLLESIQLIRQIIETHQEVLVSQNKRVKFLEDLLLSDKEKPNE